jgi:hypothetical protein|uniref:Uncharacterized protein n=1 Tax=viral metagenome TaxID=1070528 RepID=A0A6C0CJI1_9ZZZZ
MNTKHVKKIIPLLKSCYGKNKLINVIDCECINKCNMEYVIPHHRYSPMKYYTNLKCELTDSKQKLGDCNCTDRCSAKHNDLELLYELELSNLPN